MAIDLGELDAFLRAANRATYANKDASKTPSLRPASEDYHFEQGDLAYHDTYFGGRDFMGEEIVYKAGKPVWGMNYYGYLLKPEASEREVYDFLREALMQEVEFIIPVRGPSGYGHGLWSYANAAEGSLDRFRGLEAISYNDEEVYWCLYHGGIIR